MSEYHDTCKTYTTKNRNIIIDINKMIHEINKSQTINLNKINNKFVYSLNELEYFIDDTLYYANKIQSIDKLLLDKMSSHYSIIKNKLDESSNFLSHIMNHPEDRYVEINDIIINTFNNNS